MSRVNYQYNMKEKNRGKLKRRRAGVNGGPEPQAVPKVVEARQLRVGRGQELQLKWHYH